MEKVGAEEKQNPWDCGSTLYDSFELNSFKTKLDSAIANSPRTLSMPHLPQPSPRNPFNNISRSVHKFLRSVFKSSNSNKSTTASHKYSKDRFYVLYDNSASFLSTIPEVSEFEIASLSPDISSFVTRSSSERYFKFQMNT